MTFVINAYGKSGRQWALTVEAENIEQVYEVAEDLDLLYGEYDVGELIDGG